MMNVTCPDNIHITHMHTTPNIFSDRLEVFIQKYAILHTAVEFLENR